MVTFLIKMVKQLDAFIPHIFTHSDPKSFGESKIRRGTHKRSNKWKK